MTFPPARRPWLPWLILAAVPFLAYWSTLSIDYGLRDDYALLREAREESGKILAVCTAMGRPVFGWLEEVSFRAAGDVAGLADLRLLGVALLAVLGLFTRAILRRQGWNETEAFAASVMMLLLPSAQVIASWATGWPYAIAALLAAAAFAVGENLWPRITGVAPGWTRTLGCLVLLALSALTYQCHALFYLVFVAAAWPRQTAARLPICFAWLARQGWRVLGGLGLAYGVSRYIFWQWQMVPSPRFGFTQDVPGKFQWLLEQVLPDALNFFSLRNADAPWSTGFSLALALTLAFMGLGAALAARRCGLRRAALTGAGLLGMLVAACVVSLVARESFATYRTLFAAAGVSVIIFCLATREIARAWTNLKTSKMPAEQNDNSPALLQVMLGAAAGAMALLASHQCLHLFAIPQMEELMVMRLAIGDRQFTPDDRVFIVDPGADTRLGYLVFADEFGSLSTNSDWVPKEMFYQVLHERLEAELAVATEGKTDDTRAPGDDSTADFAGPLTAGTPAETAAPESALEVRFQEERPKKVAIGLQPPVGPHRYDFIIDLRLMWRLDESNS